MTICPHTQKQCVCQPSEGVMCEYGATPMTKQYLVLPEWLQPGVAYWICEHSNGPKPNRCQQCDFTDADRGRALEVAPAHEPKGDGCPAILETRCVLPAGHEGNHRSRNGLVEWRVEHQNRSEKPA